MNTNPIKLKLLFLLILAVSTKSVTAQNIFPENGNAGIGTTTPQYRLQILGNHDATQFNMRFNHHEPAQRADLTLWASEPQLTWTGVGIGNNVINTVGITRIIDTKGGSYIRLLDSEIKLNVVQQNGVDISALSVNAEGNIGIGTSTPKEKLSVNGKIRAQEVKVETANWPDYVFEENYELTSLPSLEKFIKANKHLPEVPSALEIQKSGLDLGKTQTLFLKKLEELTLILIEKDKQLQKQQQELDEVKQQLKELVNKK
ncbi:hypothetical protein ACUN24_13600 [Pedobacter sp. WC2501]|uniref:hypothetical protein n=1 Tax=Pedobacter sp. WC2501 TaxID=3461400 RepID=UPI0040460697